MPIPIGIARRIIKWGIKGAKNGDKVNMAAVMKSIDTLGDGDGTVEVSDLIDAVSDYLSDAKDALESIWDFLTDWI